MLLLLGNDLLAVTAKQVLQFGRGKWHEASVELSSTLHQKDTDSSASSSEDENQLNNNKQIVKEWLGSPCASFTIKQDGKEVTYLALCNTHKQLIILGKIDDKVCSWRQIGPAHSMPKSPIVMQTFRDSLLYIGDKFGDLWCLELEKLIDSSCDRSVFKTASPILGHFSILTHLTITENLIITCDRDEKVRVSMRDRPYLIDQFILGHTAYLIGFFQLNQKTWVSIDGNGRVCQWQWTLGNFMGLNEDSPEFKSEEDKSRASLQQNLELKHAFVQGVVFACKLYLIAEDLQQVVVLKLEEDLIGEDSKMDLPSLPIELFTFDKSLFVLLHDGTFFKLHGEHPGVPSFNTCFPTPRMSHLRKFYKGLLPRREKGPNEHNQ